ncbi:TetR family transcriptional regulator [Actinomadura nitritigenes]|uniref:TetR family transcriptional regulator n=1 Tax=Actinomadura nitritigenes TaxID=134602 RepID=A0ABS3RFG3_9ACTN|nr:TetR/AcrR family transcriptional regulator [Actinomadura nitritigenes]MBO2444974.1 TetR family transcriptional regulator [Actinomadura nitritigenes]
MARWEPGTADRLQKAALELFAAQGFEQTTATQIAQAVGLTERTFFRHFEDKREVLFRGQDALVAKFLDGVHGAPADASPLAIAACALHSAAEFFPDERRPHSRMRQSVIDQNPALQERERNKLADLAAALAGALRERGVDEPAATLAAHSGVTVFGIAFSQWLHESEQRSFADICIGLLREFRALMTDAEA